jgi:hypothetical protein
MDSDKCPKCGSSIYNIEIVDETVYIVCTCGIIHSKACI